MTRARKIKPGKAIDERMDAKAIIRFFEKIKVDDEHGCWLWTAYTDSHGYGQMCYRNKRHWVHRLAYATFNGPVPDGVEVDHINGCSPSCVNPDHLRILTPSENRTDANVRRWSNDDSEVPS